MNMSELLKLNCELINVCLCLLFNLFYDFFCRFRGQKWQFGGFVNGFGNSNFSRLFIFTLTAVFILARDNTTGDVADFRPIRGREIILHTQRIDILSGPALRAAPAKIVSSRSCCTSRNFCRRCSLSSTCQYVDSLCVYVCVV